jgi:hypothetical protein
MLDINDMVFTLRYPFLYDVYDGLYAVITAWYIQCLGYTECRVYVQAFNLLWSETGQVKCYYVVGL